MNKILIILAFKWLVTFLELKKKDSNVYFFFHKQKLSYLAALIIFLEIQFNITVSNT